LEEEEEKEKKTHGCFTSRFVFAIDTPSRRYYVEAENQMEYDSWIDAIQSAIRGKVQMVAFQSV